jgi:hypothetical protein
VARHDLPRRMGAAVRGRCCRVELGLNVAEPATEQSPPESQLAREEPAAAQAS